MSVDPQTFYQGVTAPPASDPVPAAAPPEGVAPGAAPEPEAPTPEVDYRAEAERYRQEAEEARARAAQHESRMTQVRQGLEQMMAQQAEQQRRSQYEQRVRDMTARANTMRAEDAERYIQSETQAIIGEFQTAIQQERQQAAQREQQLARALGAPLYIEKLVKDHNLPAEARQRLEAFGDPDLAERVGVPLVKDYYQQKQEWEERLRQASRTQEAQARANSGLNRLGGANPSAVSAVQVPEGLSPEQRAFWIYDNIIHGS